jgi:copper chaperone CopZ
MSTIRTVVEVPGVTCGYCKRSIESALGAVDGVTQATVELSSKTVTVAHAVDVISRERLVEEIEGCGYDVAGVREVS